MTRKPRRPLWLERLDPRWVPAFNLAGIDFGPYIDASEAPGTNTLTPTELQQRLQALVEQTGAQRVRLFAVDPDIKAAGGLIHGLGKQAYINAWIGPIATSDAANRAQLQTLANLVNSDQVDVAVIGSEAVHRGDVTAQQLIAYINDFRGLLDSKHKNIPVTTAETDEQLLAHPEIITAVSFVYANIYPFFDGVPIDNAIATLNGNYQNLVAASGGKRVEISETGWPSAGDAFGSAVPSPANASRYFQEFVAWAAANKVAYTYFEAYDEPWKANFEGPRGAHWGILQSDGTPKPGNEVVFNNGPVNRAPILNTAPSPTLNSVAEDAKNPFGTLVQSFATAGISDPDGAPAVKGIAVVSTAGGGAWQFSLNGGGSWQAVGTVSESAALLLPAHRGARMRFVPDPNFNGTVQMSFRAWDQTQGVAGALFDVTNQLGGAKAFSTTKDSASLTVTPVNDPPALTLSGSLAYVRNAPPVVLAPNATVADADSANFAGGELRVRITQGGGGNNTLAIGGSFTVDGNNNVKLGTTIIGIRTSNGVGTSELKVQFNSSATKAIVQQLVRAITYKNVSGTGGKRIIVFTISDGDGGLSAERTKTVNVS